MLNNHSVKPINKDAIIKAAEEIGKILTVQEQQEGGFGNIVEGVIAQNTKFSESFVMDLVGINDHFGDSGNPWNLLK